MRITLIQTDIAWEDKQENLRRLRIYLEKLGGQTDLIVLPETFTTGFSMNTERLAEPLTGSTISLLQQWSSKYGIALAGSLIARHTDESIRNRFFFLTPNGQVAYYDKRHLFRMGKENLHFRAGTERPIIHYQGFRILPQICYDLRFPVWSRNYQGEPYHLLIYMANWPASRRQAWDLLLPARAVENYSYVCAVNRVGTDPNGLKYDGGSAAYSYMGEELARVPDGQEGCVTLTLDGDRQEYFRRHCPMWRDMDKFGING